MYHDLWSSSFIFLDFPKKIMKYQPVIKCYKHQWENRWSPDISPRSQASSTPTWASPRAPHWSWAPRWARGKRCRPGCTSIPPGAPFGERHRCWRMRPEVEQLRKTWGFLETQQMASLKKWLFFFLTFMFFFECVDDFWDIWSHSPMKHLPVFQYSSPGNLFCIGCCVQRLSESICRIWQPRWPWVLGSCGVSAWCARLDTQTFRRSVGHRHLLRPRCSLTRTRNLRSSTSPQWVAQRIQMVFNKITLFSRGKRPPKFDPKCVNLKHGISGRCLIIIWTNMG